MHVSVRVYVTAMTIIDKMAFAQLERDDGIMKYTERKFIDGDF